MISGKFKIDSRTQREIVENCNVHNFQNFQESFLRRGRPRAWEGAGRHCHSDGGEGTCGLPEARWGDLGIYSRMWYSLQIPHFLSGEVNISDEYFQAGTWRWDWTSMFTRACAGWRGRWRPWTTGTSPSAQDRGRWRTFEWSLSDFNVLCCPGDKAGGHQDDPGGGDADAQGPVQQGQADRPLQHHLPREARPLRCQETFLIVAKTKTTSSSCRGRRRPPGSLWWWAKPWQNSSHPHFWNLTAPFEFSLFFLLLQICSLLICRACIQLCVTLSLTSGLRWFFHSWLISILLRREAAYKRSW